MKLKNPQLEQQILQTTTNIIVNEGISAVSTVKIAQKVGTSQSNIYSYFENKQGLLISTFKYNQKQLIESMTQIGLNNMHETENVKTLIQGFIQFGITHPIILRVIFIFRQQPELRHLLPRISDSLFFKKMFDLLITAQKNGKLKPGNVLFLAENVFIIIENYLLSTSINDASVDGVSMEDVKHLVYSLVFTDVI